MFGVGVSIGAISNSSTSMYVAAVLIQSQATGCTLL
jgi:hypothetical protein